MELINRIRKSRKGFTLVEIIVVLVILAILAAFTIPSMIGFVNDANEKAQIAVAREIYVAAQATATERVATGAVITASNLGAELSQTAATPLPNATMKKYLSNDIPTGATWTVTATAIGGSVPAVAGNANGNITSVAYKGTATSKTITITPGTGGSAVIN